MKSKLKDLKNRNNVEWIDVRSPSEYINGSIEGFVNMPLTNFVNHLYSVSKKSTKFVIISNDSNDLNMCKKYAQQQGFDTVYTYSVEDARKALD